jgi:hypothetical protein
MKYTGTKPDLARFRAPALGTWHALVELQSQGVVIKRLQKMQEERRKKETQRHNNPLKKNFLDKTRELLGCGAENRQHAIRAKLRWFADLEDRKEEFLQMVDKQFKLSSPQSYSYGNHQMEFAVNNSINTNFASVDYNEEYRQMLREAGVNPERNDMDFSVSGSHTKLISVTDSCNADGEACDSQEIQVKKFDAKLFSSTGLWTQSDDYLGEEWDPEESFKQLPHTMLDAEQVEHADELSATMSMLLKENNPSLFV